MDDVNLQLDVSTDPGTLSLSLLSTNNLVQVVQTPTHMAEYLLDVVVVRSDTEVTCVNVPQPVLSNHSMIDVVLGLPCGVSVDHETTTYRTCRLWRTFDYNDFERDLCQSALVR